MWGVLDLFYLPTYIPTYTYIIRNAGCHSAQRQYALSEYGNRKCKNGSCCGTIAVKKKKPSDAAKTADLLLETARSSQAAEWTSRNYSDARTLYKTFWHLPRSTTEHIAETCERVACSPARSLFPSRLNW